MARTVFTGGLVFDGTGAAPAPGEVVVEGDRVVETRAGWQHEHGTDEVVDATGCTVMPGMIESHAHLTFPSAVDFIDPSFNPPLDVSFFHHIEGMPTELARAERNAKILLDAGFTSAYSAGSILPMPTEVILRDKLRAGVVPGPRLLAASMERDNHPLRPDGHLATDWQGPDACRAFVAEQAAHGFRQRQVPAQQRRRVHPRRLADHPVLPGGSRRGGRAGPRVGCLAELPRAVGRVGQDRGAGRLPVDLPLHLRRRRGARPARVGEGFRLRLARSRHHLRQRLRGRGVRHYPRGRDVDGFGRGARRHGSVYPEIRKRGIRALPGGDYGFPNNPIGRNARDLQLFVEVLGYTALEALTAVTKLGGQLMGMGDELGLLAPGYIADVLLVRGNPADDVTILQDKANLIAIMQGGRFYKQPAGVPAHASA